MDSQRRLVRPWFWMILRSQRVNYGTGSLAQLILSEQLTKPGVWPVEASLSTDRFQAMLDLRGVTIEQKVHS